MANRTIKIGVNILVRKDNKILLGQRIGDRGNGTWSLPGGHVEYGEGLGEAAIRELREETGFNAIEVEFSHIINDPISDCHYVHIGFLANEYTGELCVMEPDKFAAWEWFSFEDIPEQIFEGSKRALDAFREHNIFLDAR